MKRTEAVKVQEVFLVSTRKLQTVYNINLPFIPTVQRVTGISNAQFHFSGQWLLGPTRVHAPEDITIGPATFARYTLVTSRQTDRQKDRQTDRRTDRQTDRQTA